MNSGILSFGIGNAPDNNLGECIENLESLPIESSNKPDIGKESGLTLNLTIYKPCSCNVDCDVAATLNGQQIAVQGISFDIRKEEKEHCSQV